MPMGPPMGAVDSITSGKYSVRQSLPAFLRMGNALMFLDLARNGRPRRRASHIVTAARFARLRLHQTRRTDSLTRFSGLSLPPRSSA